MQQPYARLNQRLRVKPHLTTLSFSKCPKLGRHTPFPFPPQHFWLSNIFFLSFRNKNAEKSFFCAFFSPSPSNLCPIWIFFSLLTATPPSLLSARVASFTHRKNCHPQNILRVFLLHFFFGFSCVRCPSSAVCEEAGWIFKGERKIVYNIFYAPRLMPFRNKWISVFLHKQHRKHTHGNFRFGGAWE